VEAEQWDLAAAAIFKLPARDELVVASANDTLLVSSHIAIGDLFARYPQLSEAMKAKQRIGGIRLTQGLKYGDMQLVESVAARFSGTQVGREALAALADYDLSRGEFLLAGQRYRELSVTAPPSSKDMLDAKYRLAMAMSGELVAGPTGQSVTLGERTCSAREFETILENAAKRAGSRESTDLRGAISAAPASTKWVLARTLTLSVPVAESFDNTFYPQASIWDVNDYIDPAGIGWTSADGRLYIHRQGRLTAIDAASGKTMLDVAEPFTINAEPRNAAIDPVIHADHVIVPLYWRTRSELTCFHAKTGAIVWQRPMDDAVIGLSPGDNGELLVVTVAGQQGGYGDVVLRRVDPASGMSVIASTIARVHLVDALFQVSRIESRNDRILLRVGCSLVCCDSMGALRWIAPLPHIPAEFRLRSLHQHAGGDLVMLEDRVIGTAPGSWNIECRGIDSGRLLWRHQNPALRRVVGRCGDRVIVETEGALLGLDLSTGDVRWSQPFTDPPRTVLLDEQGNVLRLGSITTQEAVCIRRYRGSDGQPLPPVEVGDDARQSTDAARALTDGERLYRLVPTGEDNPQIMLQIFESEE